MSVKPGRPNQAQKTCTQCLQVFPVNVTVDGKRMRLRRRTKCLACDPYRTAGHENHKEPVGRPPAALKVKTPPTIVMTDVMCSLCGRGVAENVRLMANSTRRLCRSCSLRVRRLHRKYWCAMYLGGKCATCGRAVEPMANLAAFDFHHYQGEKLFELNNGRSRSWRSVKAELEKCVLLCAWCHRLEHSDPMTQVILAQVMKTGDPFSRL